MSEENVEIVRAAIDAFNRGDWDAILDASTPDVEVDMSRAVGPAHGVYGREQMVEFWTEFTAHWESYRLEPTELIEMGEHLVVPWTLRAVGRDGIEVEARVNWTWTIREGMIARVAYYPTREAALEAAGLSE
jgi:ketosteroid isomerase-like protein